MNLLHKVLRALHHMSDAERLLWIVLIVGAALSGSLPTLKRWWRRWRNYRARKKFEEAARREEAARWEGVVHRPREGHRTGHVAARYKRWDDWLKKIGYPKGGKSSRD